MKYTDVTLQVPEDMKFIFTLDDENTFGRNAMILYPYVMRADISNGRAAEILGVSKLELIDYYEKQGLMSYITPVQEVKEDMATLRALRR